MKTEDLIEALNLVSMDYITETKPEPMQHTGSRRQKRDAAGEQITVSRSNAAPGKERTLKTVSVIHTHRLLTGLAAAAACAVFVCGGWMILKLSGQQQMGMDASSEKASLSESVSDSQTERIEEIPQREQNFLGGQGEIHSLGCGNFMYDDTRFYFERAICYAERTDGEQAVYRSMPTETANFFSKLYNDGSRFYYAKEHGLYPVATDGTISDTPFFALTDDMLPDGLSVSDFPFEDIGISMFRMTEDAVLIQIEGDQSTDFCCVQAVCHTDGTVNLLSGSRRYSDTAHAEDGSLFAEFRNSDGRTLGIARVGTDGSEEEYTRFSDNSNFVRYMQQHGDKLYILLDTGTEDHHTLEYGVLDLNEPHDVSNVQFFSEENEQWIEYAFSNGQRDFVVTTEQKGYGAVLYSTNPSWENREELFCASDYGIEGVFLADADENYVILSLYGLQYAVYDLRTGSVQLFRATDETDGNTGDSDALHVDESLYNELDPGFTGTNFLGGQGSLHIPKNGSDVLLYDDSYFYYPAGCFPRSGNQKTEIPVQNEMVENYQTGRVFGSGDRLFLMKNDSVNLIDSSGSTTLFLRFADAGLTGDVYVVSQVSRVGDHLLFPCRGTDSGAEYWAYIWTDLDGNILEVKTDLPADTEFIDVISDDSHMTAYYMDVDNGCQIHRIPLPGSGEEQAGFTLPGYGSDRDPQHIYVNAYGDRIFYFDQNDDFCAYDPDTGEKSVILEADSHAVGFELTLPVINGRLYYMLTDPYSEEPQKTEIMQLDLNTGERQKVLSFDQSYISSSQFLSVYSGQLFILTNGKFMLYNPETGVLFRQK